VISANRCVNTVNKIGNRNKMIRYDTQKWIDPLKDRLVKIDSKNRFIAWKSSIQIAHHYYTLFYLRLNHSADRNSFGLRIPTTKPSPLRALVSATTKLQLSRSGLYQWHPRRVPSSAIELVSCGSGGPTYIWGPHSGSNTINA